MIVKNLYWITEKKIPAPGELYILLKMLNSIGKNKDSFCIKSETKRYKWLNEKNIFRMICFHRGITFVM